MSCRDFGPDLNFYLDVLRPNKLKLFLDLIQKYDIIKQKGDFQMKRKLHKIMRRFVRDVARFIIGFDNCPVECKKDHLHAIAGTVAGFLGGVAAVAFFTAMFLFLA